MASAAHCFYCFECLDAKFEHRNAPNLDRYLDLYERFSSKAATREPQGPASETGDNGNIEDARRETEEAQSDGTTTRPQNPSISRLQASTPSSRSSSSSLSADSSASHLTTSTGATTPSAAPSYASRLSVEETFPLFITWNTLSRSGNKSLRGCIGTFEPLPLASGLQSYSVIAAFEDTRFSPIPASLVPSLSCSLTLLADFEPCQNATDWDLGTHGIRISFVVRNRRHGATYLPDVAVEQGWTKEEALESLMRKAGWNGSSERGSSRRSSKGAARDNETSHAKPWEEVDDFKTVRYTGLKASASYSDWQEFKAWVAEHGETVS